MDGNGRTKLRRPERAELAAAVENNSVEACRAWAAWPRMRVHDEPDVVWTITDLPFPQFNAVLRARLPAEGVDAAVAAVLGPFRERGLPMAWWTGPQTAPGDLDARLAAAGLVLSDDSLGMAFDLDELPRALREVRSSAVVVEEVVCHGDLNAWSNLIGRVFGYSRRATANWTAMHEACGFGPGYGWRHYLGSLGGRAVGAASVFLGSEVAGIANVAVDVAMRGRGAATALAVRALQDAHTAGYDIATLWASPDGERVYRRLGFESCCRGRCWIDRGGARASSR